MTWNKTPVLAFSWGLCENLFCASGNKTYYGEFIHFYFFQYLLIIPVFSLKSAFAFINVELLLSPILDFTSWLLTVLSPSRSMYLLFRSKHYFFIYRFFIFLFNLFIHSFIHSFIYLFIYLFIICFCFIKTRNMELVKFTRISTLEFLKIKEEVSNKVKACFHILRITFLKFSFSLSMFNNSEADSFQDSFTKILFNNTDTLFKTIWKEYLG